MPRARYPRHLSEPPSSATLPPGRRMRAISASACGRVNQWKARPRPRHRPRLPAARWPRRYRLRLAYQVRHGGASEKLHGRVDSDCLTARTAQRGRELPCSPSLPRSIPSTGPRRQPLRPSARPHRRLTPLTPRSTATADQTRTGNKIVALKVPWRRPARDPTGTRGGNCSRCTARFCAPRHRLRLR